MMGRVRRLGLIGASAALLSSPVVAEQPWIKLYGDGFMLRGQMSSDTLGEVACDLQTARQTLSVAFPAIRPVPKVVAVRDLAGLRAWLPLATGSPLGAYWRGLYGDHIVVRTDARPDERRRRVLHEYAHFVTHVALADPPTWLDEGAAEFWEHATVTGTEVEVAQPVPEHLEQLRKRGDWIPLSQLLSANTIPRGAAESAMFYAESWALVRYLMLEKWAGNLAITRAPAPAEIPSDAELRDYSLKSDRSVKVLTRLGAPCVKTSVKQMDEFADLLERAQALADGDRPEAALPLLRTALARRPGSADVMEAIGFIGFRGNRFLEAAAVFDQVILAGKASHIGYYYRALLAEPVPNESNGGGPISQIEYLRRAIGLNPGFAPAVERLQQLIRVGNPLAPIY